jgi:hypothetical protein
MPKPRKPRRNPRRLTPEQFQALQQKWYKKAKDSGFKDIECGKDLNKFPAQTFRQSGTPWPTLLWDFSGTGGISEDDQDGSGLKGWDGVSDFSDHPKYEYFDRILAHAYTHPVSSKRRKVLLLAVDVGVTEAARRLKMQRTEASNIWEETLQMLGLPGQTRTVKDKEAEPAPVRSLSAREIAGLNLTPPKRIKDRTRG